MSAWKIWDEASLYFITSTIVGWYPVFTKISYFNIIIESLQYCRVNKGLYIYAYVVMLNHIHLIVSVEESVGSLSNTFRDLKRHTSREISKQLKKDGNEFALDFFSQATEQTNRFKVWQEGFHPKVILNEKFCLQKLAYIHNNPVRKGYVTQPEHWFYSSAGFYAGLANLALQIDNIFE